MRRVLIVVVAMATIGAAALPALATHKADREVRFATFNASLNRFNAGDLVTELEDAVAGTVTDQLQAVLDIIAINDADVLLINEFDYDADERAAELFAHLSGYRYWFTAPSNTGIDSGFDLDNDGLLGGPGDAYGFGFHEGQFGMLVLSRYPISKVRTFQHFLWKDMPGALLPELDGEPWYSDEELAVFRLSSKSHWDLRIKTPRGPVTSWSATRRRPSSTATRTATELATTMRSGSGRTTSPGSAAATSTTTPGAAAACGAEHS